MGAQALTMFKGNTSLPVPVPFAVLGASGLSLYTSIWVTAKHSTSDPDTASAGLPQAVFQKTLATGVAITTAGNASTNGLLTVTLVDADTSGLYDIATPLVYDVKGKVGTTEQTLVSDTLIVNPHSTKAT